MPLQISTTSGKPFKKILLTIFSSLPLYFIPLWKILVLYSIVPLWAHSFPGCTHIICERFEHRLDSGLLCLGVGVSPMLPRLDQPRFLSGIVLLPQSSPVFGTTSTPAACTAFYLDLFWMYSWMYFFNTVIYFTSGRLIAFFIWKISKRTEKAWGVLVTSFPSSKTKRKRYFNFFFFFLEQSVMKYLCWKLIKFELVKRL